MFFIELYLERFPLIEDSADVEEGPRITALRRRYRAIVQGVSTLGPTRRSAIDHPIFATPIG